MDLQTAGGALSGVPIGVAACVGLTFVVIAGHEPRRAQEDGSLAITSPTKTLPAPPFSRGTDPQPTRGPTHTHGRTSGTPLPSRAIGHEGGSFRDAQGLVRPGAGDRGVVVGSDGVNWCDLFRLPDVASTRVAQALVGDTVRVRRHQGAWSEVEAADGIAWAGWMSAACVTRGQADFSREIAAGPWFVVVAAPMLHTPLGDLPFGAVLPDVSKAGTTRVRLPDGRVVSVDADAVRARGAVSLDEALKRAQRFLRAPYQQGANTVEAMDAAGLVQLIFRVVGRPLPRGVDALQRAGQNVLRDQMRAGDVIFFSTFDATQPHAVILLDTGRTFLEASPASGVNLGLMEQMRNRSIVAVRRYASPRGFLP
jgi:cell wall-associated NlpC family hydrolase